MATLKQLIRLSALLLAASVLLFLINRYLVFWQQWPDLATSLSYWLGNQADDLTPAALLQGAALWILYLATFIWIIQYTRRSADTSLMVDAERFSRWSAFIVRAAFWSVFLVGLADVTISLMRVEGWQTAIVGQTWADIFDQASTRGTYVHYPLIALAFVIAALTRSLGFIWLAFLVVIAEFIIVVSRFVFSYEQAFMGDLVRFWYAALFLFASAYTLIEDAHVRVDLLYTNFTTRTKAWVNTTGSLVLGLPLCWMILSLGMGNRQGILIAPVISFEISQSSYGMYIQYLMATLLIVFASSMALQFISYYLSHAAILLNDTSDTPESELPSSPSKTPEQEAI